MVATIWFRPDNDTCQTVARQVERVGVAVEWVHRALHPASLGVVAHFRELISYEPVLSHITSVGIYAAEAIRRHSLPVTRVAIKHQGLRFATLLITLLASLVLLTLCLGS